MPHSRRIFLLLLYLMLFTLLGVSIASLPEDRTADASETAASYTENTFLLLGIDNVSYSSDVILLAHIDSDGKALKLLQIPRDSYVPAYGKINSVFATHCKKALEAGKTLDESYEEGALALVSFLGNALGVGIGNYAVLTLADFRSLVDGIGGVPINVPQALDYEDPAQELVIHLEAGEQVLDGKAAEGLVRCRSAYIDADYGRMDAQKLFMAAFFKKLKYETPPLDMLAFIRNAHRCIRTDITLSRALSIGRAIITAKGDSLCFATLKGSSLRIGKSLCEVLPKESISAASAYLEGVFSEEQAQKAFCGSSEAAEAIYLAPAESPFSPHAAKEIEEKLQKDG